MDDELAKKLAFEDLAELRRVMDGRIQREYDAMSRVRLKRELLDALAEQANFEAPQGMVDQEFDQIWQRLEAERKEGRSTRTTRTRTRRRCGPTTAPLPSGGSSWAWCWRRSAGPTASP